MIQIIPSISLMGGKVVRTIKGNIDEVKVYDRDPLDLAMAFEANGVKRLHVIDLDGAKMRKVVNYNILELITKYTKLEVDFSGGVTNDDQIRTAFEFGAKYVTVATVAVHEKEKFNQWLITYGGNKVILAADSKDGVVLTRGWVRSTGIDLMEHLTYYQERGIQYVKCTEIARDGSLEGPALDLYKNILAKFPDLKILASGGIRSVEDIEALQEIGVHGVIFGKSFYDEKIKLEDLKKYLG